jgi:hypothetical protein
MIGVIARVEDRPVVEEFFQLFKTAWEFHRPCRTYDVLLVTAPDAQARAARLTVVCNSQSAALDCSLGITMAAPVRGITAESASGALPLFGDVAPLACDTAHACLTVEGKPVGLRLQRSDGIVVRLGYDLFAEVRQLLSAGQPLPHAQCPTLDRHIAMMREWITSAGVPFVEIRPVPAGHAFTVCLTHDIDFYGIRRHKLDHTAWGFLYRATLGTLRDLARRRVSLRRAVANWKAAASLPLVYAGLVRDFWLPDWYLEVERGLPATYYVIPFKGRAGEKLTAAHASRRACAYDLAELADWLARLQRAGCEIGVHGLDAWHSGELGRQELERVRTITGAANIGVRMHWLLFDDGTPEVLEQSGYDYDSTSGFNEGPGYRNGTAQAFRPLGRRKLLELPMHIQDGALFLSKRLHLAEDAALEVCRRFIDHARRDGGVVTLLWHDRSHAPERLWGDVYVRLLGELVSAQVWFATGAQAVEWFRKRRDVTFHEHAATGNIVLQPGRGAASPAMTVRIHHSSRAGANASASGRNYRDLAWNCAEPLALNVSDTAIAV